MRALVIVFASLAACDGAASPELGREAKFQVLGAQWAPGPPPAARGGPAVTGALFVGRALLRDGYAQRLIGSMGNGTTGMWIGLDGDDGGWILPADPPSTDVPDQPTFDLDIAIGADAPLGPIDLRIVASDADGRAGEAYTLTIMSEDVPPPAGELVFGLSWEGTADLDLHVVEPGGNEAWWGDPNTYEPPPPGQPFDPNAWRRGGLLDRDANGACRRDARPREHVVWTMPPPSGHYIVRVDTKSLCGAPSAYWFASAYRNGTLVDSAQGLAVPEDELAPHGAGAGVTVIELDLP
jgi:hypothetical protein